MIMLNTPEKNGVQQKDILELISYSEVVVSLDKEKRAIDERKSNLKNQRNENHQALKQELARRDSMIQALTMENQNIQEKASQEVLKKDITMKHLEVEKQQILTELNQLKHQATERLQYFTQRNKTLEDKLETKNKQVGQLQSENCTLQNLLKLKQYQHGQYRQQTEQQQSYKYLLQHQYHQNSESKLLSEPESNTAALLKQENQKLLNEINTLKASSTQFEQEAKAGKEKLIMLQTINQSLRDSNDQMTKMTERLEKSNQSYVEVLEQEKQKIAQEVEVLKQGNIDLEKKMSHLGAKQVAQEPRIQNIIKQKDRKIKALELDLQKLHTLYDQTTFEAHEMMTILNNQNGALEEENQTVRDELEFKVACEKKLESKIASLEKEIKRLKCLSASFEYETSL
jgi:hypothetical protein